MSPRSYQGRHHAARHAAGRAGLRFPRAFSHGFVLPTAAAAALVVTATGASVADSAPLTSAPLTLSVSGQQSAMARTQQAVDEEMVTNLALRRQDATLQSAAIQGRAEAQVKATRDAQRAVLAAQAKATAAKKAAQAKAAAAKKAAQAKAAAAKQAADRAEREGKAWVRPIKVWNITSSFGWRWGRIHQGIDLGAPMGTPTYAMSKGTVIGSFYSSGFGNKVEIQYWDGSISWYAHLSKRLVTEGQTVMPGQLVGLVGNTGHSFGPHLHFEMQKSAASNDPLPPEPWLRSKGLL
ncbi:MAG: M23 family metallopeptidase [Ornithinibacter sp.]